MELKGYKGFNKDLTCRDFQYEIGKEYKHDGDIELCNKGFHFCKRLIDIHGYYDLTNEDVRVCEIVASGNIIEGDNKCVTDTIKIIRELSKKEIEEMKNTGKGNSGIREHRIREHRRREHRKQEHRKQEHRKQEHRKQEHRRLEHRKQEHRRQEHRKQEHRKQEHRRREHRKQEHRKREHRRLEHNRQVNRLFLHNKTNNEIF